MPCKSSTISFPCEKVESEPDLNGLIKNKYLSKQEADIYKTAQQNGFNVSISQYVNYSGSKASVELIIEINKTKIL